MRLLVINCGSSSIKYQLFDMPGRESVAKGIVEQIGGAEASMVHRHAGGQQEERRVQADNHQEAMAAVLKRLASDADERQIDAVGHRVVHGGEEFTESVLVDDAVLAAIERMSPLAPLHNPHNLTGIRAAMHVLPEAKQVVCFDTAFHATLPPVAYLYALPYELYETWRIRRYGFHGTSHRYVSRRVAELLGRRPDETNCITCHLGNGSSITAVERGRSVDTSMGFTPLAGVPMGTRSGDIDPAILFYLQHHGYDLAALEKLLNKQSGMLGISGCSNDMRTLLDEAEAGGRRAQLAIDVFCYQVKKYVAAYHAVLGKVHALVMTGGIGENAPLIRARICTGLENLAINCDPQRNRQCRGAEARIDAGSGTPVYVIPTDEEGMIAQDTYQLAAP